MPYPAQFDHDNLIETAREMLESEGLEQLTLSKLAQRLGVKAPSLYKHFKNKNALLQEVNLLTMRNLVAATLTAIESADGDSSAAILAMLQGYRAFAHQNPQSYLLAYNSSDPELVPDPEIQEQLVLPLQALMAQVAGEANSLAALRGAWALVHGFVLLEINDQFQRSGDVGEAFTKSVQAYIDGWARS